jgi:hypothetical protein
MHRPKGSTKMDGTAARPSRACLLLAAILLVGCSGLDPNIGPRNTDDIPGGDGGGTNTDPVLPGEVSFALQIRPLMDRPGRGDPTGKGCKGCHYSTEPNHMGVDLSALDLATLGSLRRGGGSSGRRIIVPGKPSESVLVQALKGTYAFSNRMPKNGPFWDEGKPEPVEIPLVEQWIREGAKGADDE